MPRIFKWTNLSSHKINIFSITNEEGWMRAFIISIHCHDLKLRNARKVLIHSATNRLQSRGPLYFCALNKRFPYINLQRFHRPQCGIVFVCMRVHFLRLCLWSTPAGANGNLTALRKAQRIFLSLSLALMQQNYARRVTSCWPRVWLNPRFAAAVFSMMTVNECFPWRVWYHH